MAAYEFYCSECRTSFEVLRSMADADSPLQCASCGSAQHVNRVISTFAVLGGGRGTDAESSGVFAAVAVAVAVAVAAAAAPAAVAANSHSRRRMSESEERDDALL